MLTVVSMRVFYGTKEENTTDPKKFKEGKVYLGS